MGGSVYLPENPHQQNESWSRNNLRLHRSVLRYSLGGQHILSRQESTGAWTARGTDKQGDFTLKGKVEGSDVRFVKDFTSAGGYKNIKYSGTVENDEVKGDYHFVYKALFINLPVNENFYMKVTN